MVCNLQVRTEFVVPREEVPRLWFTGDSRMVREISAAFAVVRTLCKVVVRKEMYLLIDILTLTLSGDQRNEITGREALRHQEEAWSRTTAPSQ